MGMFGVIWVLLVGGSLAKDGIKGAIKDCENKNKALNNPNNIEGIYYDHSKQVRDLYTNEKLRYRADYETREMWLVDSHGKRIKNVTNLKRENERINAKLSNNPNMTVIDYASGPTVIKEAGSGKLNILGRRYQDIETGKIYVERCFKRFTQQHSEGNHWPSNIKEIKEMDLPRMFVCTFYMDIETGKLVRVTDKEKQERSKKNNELLLTEEEIEKFIKAFNDYQEKIKSTIDFTDQFEFTKFYWNHYEH